MALLTRHRMPPGGFFYREPTLNWSTPNPHLPFDLIAFQIQAVRLANPSAGLDPSTYACQTALDTYTCARLHNDPKWCAPPESAVARAVEEARKPRESCAGCGKNRKRAKATP